tara:strand:- start:20 stop:319 length:300 start_codon:yes stop_codon:yes gene_type:complete
MCTPIAGMLGSGGLLENLGDPLGTRKRREDDQKAKWAREDSIREATFAHEQTMADKQYGTGNRGKLTAGSSSSGTRTGGQGGNKTRYSSGTGGSQSSKY